MVTKVLTLLGEHKLLKELKKGGFMRSFLATLTTALVFTSGSAFGYGLGTSTYPLMTDKKVIGVEMTGIVSNGKGVGLQGRYTHKLTNKIIVDGGAGIGAGDRSNRIFAGADYELFPDYMKQPKISANFRIENAKEGENRKNIVTLAPKVSKGFSFWGTEGFPYAALPLGLSLEGETSTYTTTASLNLGIAGKLPIDGYRHLNASIEGIVGLKDSFSGIFLGVSYPLDK